MPAAPVMFAIRATQLSVNYGAAVPAAYRKDSLHIKGIVMRNASSRLPERGVFSLVAKADKLIFAAQHREVEQR